VLPINRAGQKIFLIRLLVAGCLAAFCSIAFAQTVRDATTSGNPRAFTSNAISGDHRRYLQLGGLGFLFGDGNLTYGREKIMEGFYTAHVWRGALLSFDLQHVNNPE